jgi:hypothetical protein
VSFTDPLLSSEVDKEKAHQGGIVRTEHHGNLPTRGLPASMNFLLSPKCLKIRNVRQKIKLVRALNGLLYTNWEMLHGF